MNTITIEKLGETPLSDLIESVFWDIKRARNHGIELHMGHFLARYKNIPGTKDHCSACLGGIALLGFLEDKHLEERYFPSISEAIYLIPYEQRKRANTMMHFFDSLRCKTISFYGTLGPLTGLNNEQLSPLMDVIIQWFKDYPVGYYEKLNKGNIKRLEDELKVLINKLREHGF